MSWNAKNFFKSQFFIITVLLVLKAFFVRATLFTDHNLLRAFLLELSVFIFISGLVELFLKRGKKFVYFFLNLIFSVLFLAIVVYYDQFSRIPIYTALYQIGEAEQVGSSIQSLLKPSDFILFADLIVFAVMFVLRKYPLQETVALKKRHLAWLVVLAMLVSGFNTYTKKNEDLLDPSKLADNVGLLNAEAFETYTELTDSVPKNLVVNQTNIDQAKGIQEPTDPKYFGVAKNQNLIMIQLESFQNFLIGLKIGGQEVTPNLNKLVQQSLYFPHYNTQIGQGNTNDAEFISNTSLLPLENGAMSSLHDDKQFPSLPRLLGENGYDTFTMHVNTATFYNRNKMYPAMGYNQYYDQSYFGTSDTIGMGASDDVLFTKSLPLLLQRKNNGQKFYANYVTLSSHNPFKIPAGYQTLNLPAEYNGSMVADYLQAAHYTDQELGKFIDELKQNGLYDNTLLCLYGDHWAFSADTAKPQDKQLLNQLVGHTYDYTDMYNIPMIMKVPGMKPQTVALEGGQADTMPTLTNLLGINLNQVHFGEDLLNQTTNLFGERYYLPKGSFINQDVLWVSDGGLTINNLTHQTSTQTSQFSAENQDVLKLEEMSDSYIDHLPKNK